jgi:hypothetical protein
MNALLSIEPAAPYAGDLLPTLRGNTRNAVAGLCDYLAHLNDEVLNGLARSVSEAIHAEHVFTTERGQFIEYLEPIHRTEQRAEEMIAESEARLLAETGRMIRALEPSERMRILEETLLTLRECWISPGEEVPPVLQDVLISYEDPEDGMVTHMAYRTNEDWLLTGCDELPVPQAIMGWLPLPEAMQP